MKKLLPYILILVVLVGVFGPIDIVYSQSIFRLSVSSLLQSAVVNLANAILIFLSWIAGFAGAILDYVLSFTIVNMNVNVFGDGSPANPGITGINTAWKIIKDLMNIAFIFILLYESIKIIIGQGSVESVKRFVLGIVLASLLINFSLFFTKVLIDASNIVTIGVYRSILSTPVAPPQPGQPPTTNSIATILLSKLKLQTIYSTSNPDLSTNGIGGALIFLIGSSIIFLISTFILFAITANFVIRYITLIILLVLSPIAYMGIALNAVQPYQKKWWDSLKGQLLFAPVFMIMLMIVITLISSPGFVSQGTFADLFLNTNVSPNANAASGSGATAGTSASGLVLNFALVIGLLIATLTVSKSVAKSGADQIGTMTSKLTGYAGGVFMGGSAALGRRTIGAAASRVSESQTFNNWAGRSRIGEFALNRTRGVASSSFDTRASKLGEKLSSVTGTDFGKAKEGGFNKTLEEKTKAQEKFGESLRGNVAKEQYAARIASKLFTRGGSNNSRISGLGMLGRSDRIVASKILNKQIEPLDQAVERQQSREVTLTQQETNINNEISTLQAMTNRNANQDARLATLTAPAYQPAPAGSPPGTRGPANRSSLDYIQEQLRTTRNELINTTTERDRIRGIITSTGLANTEGVAVPGQATAGQTRRLAQLQAQLAMINRVVATNPGGTPSPAQATRITNINNQIAGLTNAINTTIANTTTPADPALGVRNIQTGAVRGRRADEQNF